MTTLLDVDLGATLDAERDESENRGGEGEKRRPADDDDREYRYKQWERIPAQEGRRLC